MANCIIYIASASYASKWRETIKNHQADVRNTCSRDTVYEVNQQSFANWQRVMGLAMTTYPGAHAGRAQAPAAVPGNPAPPATPASPVPPAPLAVEAAVWGLHQELQLRVALPMLRLREDREDPKPKKPNHGKKQKQPKERKDSKGDRDSTHQAGKGNKQSRHNQAGARSSPMERPRTITAPVSLLCASTSTAVPPRNSQPSTSKGSFNAGTTGITGTTLSQRVIHPPLARLLPVHLPATRLHHSSDKTPAGKGQPTRTAELLSGKHGSTHATQAELPKGLCSSSCTATAAPSQKGSRTSKDWSIRRKDNLWSWCD